MEPDKQSFQEIYLSIGYCVSKWEHLETRLFFMYSALASGDHFADLQAYSSILSFRSRANTIERLADYRLANHSELLGSCKTMLERIRRLSKRRNEVVHGQIASMRKVEVLPNGEEKITVGLFVENSVYGSTFDVMITKKSYSYTANEIINFSNSFETCREDLNELCDKISAETLNSTLQGSQISE